jgi:hypothetical protein
LFPHADVIGLELYFPALRCLFNLFLHADVYWPWVIFSCIEMFIQFVSSCRCLLALSYIFLHWDVYSICFLMQMFISFDLYFPAWTCYFKFVSSGRCYCPLHCVSCIEMFILIVSSCRWRSCAPWIMFFLHCDVYLICFFMQMLLALDYILLPWDLYSICFLVQMYIGLALGFLPYLFIYFVSSCSS